MVNGLYTASLGMMHLLRKQEINANNLANANTTGFKTAELLTRTEVTIDRNDELKLHQDEDQYLDEVHTSFDQGPLIQTDNNLDLAISGKGFFLIDTPQGKFYTRNGSFAVNSDNELVTFNGHKVLADNGDSIIVQSHDFSVASDGGLHANSKKIGQLGVFNFPDANKLLSQGDGLYANPDLVNNQPMPDDTAKVQQGYLEASNVDTVNSMIRMITYYRNYEADQKVVHAIDETIEKAVNQIGVVG